MKFRQQQTLRTSRGDVATEHGAWRPTLSAQYAERSVQPARSMILATRAPLRDELTLLLPTAGA